MLSNLDLKSVLTLSRAFPIYVGVNQKESLIVGKKNVLSVMTIGNFTPFVKYYESKDKYFEIEKHSLKLKRAVMLSTA